MTDNPIPLSTQPAVPSQISRPPPQGSTGKDDVGQKVETVEEEPYTIKCICNFSDDDGYTIYCETCDTWQHIECFYPDNREEAMREDFAHSCAECQPRPLDRLKAIERIRLRNAPAAGESTDKKTKRPPAKNHKKKPKPTEIHVNGHPGSHDTGKHGSPIEQTQSSKKSKSSHRPSQSLGSNTHTTKRSPSYANARANPANPPSPATTPPDLPDDFRIHHYSAGFCSLYDGPDVFDTHNNGFASLAIPTALSRWLREPETMKHEVGRTHVEVFQSAPPNVQAHRPQLEVQDATRQLDSETILRWRFLKSTAPIEKDVSLIELNGEIGFQKDYCAEPGNVWADLSSPLPFVFFHPMLPLYIDTRKEGSSARYVRRSCKPNAQLDTYLSDGSEYHFWLVSDRYIAANEQITLPWDFRLDKSVGARWMHLLGLSDDDIAGQNEPEMDETEYLAISNWIDRILSEYGGCACDLDNNCAFARFHRHYLYGKNFGRSHNKKKQRKTKTRTISPTSTGHATNSRAASEGHADEAMDQDGRSQSGSSRSKPPSRERTPLRQGSFDQLGILTEPTDRDKRKVAMVEDSFRRMEQQQPPRKKKRVSDGTTTSTSSKPKSRNGSTFSHGNYVDSGTSRSKSRSPSSARSPHITQKPLGSRHEPSSRSRQSSASTTQPVYCDAAVQTDPVEGEWFSEAAFSPRPRKRIISLSKRLLNNRHRARADEAEHRRQSLATQISSGTVMDIDSPATEHKPSFSDGNDVEMQSPVSQGDIAMVDVSRASVTPAPGSVSSEVLTSPLAAKTPDLRVQMPPVPAFDSNVQAVNGITTPLSASGSIIQSPLSSGAFTSPFTPAAISSIAVQPSPVKKKLSLSDYTKSRMNKAAGKVSGGGALLKPSIPSPEETKMEITVESHPVEQAGENMAPPPMMPATTNGST